MKNYIGVNKTEEEKVKEVKDWIKNNFLVIILGIGTGLGSVFGWQYYNTYLEEQKLEARVQYLQGIDNDSITVNNHQEYQNQLLFVNAKNTIDDPDTALNFLQKVESEDITKHIKDIKLAQVYLDKGEYQTALDLLENNPLNATSLHLTGDIYMTMGDNNIAREIYTEALEKTRNINIKNILRAKINNLQ